MTGALRTLSLAVAALLLSTPVRAQVYSFRSLTTGDGLPHPFVYCVTQDHFGYLWFGTFGGAARYDGDTFERWGLREGFPGDDVRAILEDGRGRIWFAMNGGVARLSRGPNGEVLRESLKVFTVREGLLAPFAHALVEDASGRIWVATRDGGLAVVGESGVEKTLRSGREIPAATVWSGLRVKNALWFGTRGDGVVRIQGERIELFGKEQGLPDLHVFDLALGPDGAVTVATSGGVARLGASGRFETVPYAADASSPASSVAFDSTGALWVGRYGRGLVKSSPSGSTLFREAQGLPSDVVTGLYFDREGTLWIATQGAGAVRFSSDRFAAYDKTVGWPGGVASAFAEQKDGTLWIGSFGKGAMRIDAGGATRTVSKADGLADELVRSIRVDREETLWVGTSSGLSYRRRGESRFRTISVSDGLPDAYVTALVEAPDGALFIGTSKGLVRRVHSGEIRVFRKADGLIRDEVESLAISPDGKVYVGTADGLSVFDGAEFQNRPGGEGIPPGRIFGMAWGRDHTFWVGGDGGLGAVRGKDSVPYGPSEGLPASAVAALVTDADGTLWAGSGRGVARYVGDHFQARDGMPSEDVFNRAAFRDSKGRLWWGTPIGPVVYTAANDRINAAPPAVYVTGVVASGRTYHGSQRVALPLDATTLTFQFVALSYARPTRVLYKTRLAGFDPEWSAPATRHEVRYTNLPPGSYRFEVVAANNDGVWSPSPAALPIFVPTPWWQTPLAYVVYVVALLGLGLLFHELRVLAMRRRAAALEALVEKRTSEVQAADRAKGDFVAIVSHELRTPLSSIQGSIALITSGVLGEPTQEVKQVLEIVQRNGERLLRLINDILDVEKIEAGALELHLERLELGPILKRAVLETEGYARPHGVKVTLVDEKPRTFVNADSDRLIQILVNLLSNAVKFSAQNGHVTLKAEPGMPGWVRISVVDRGPGIPPDLRPRIFEKFAQTGGARPKGTGLGLTITKSLVDRHGGRIGFETELDKGTTFWVELPTAS